MKVYLSGAMSGLPDQNFPEFHRCAKILRDKGFEVFSPAEQDEADGLVDQPETPWAVFLRRDIKALMDCEAIAMIPGWRKSKGACLEHYNAVALGMPVYDANTGELMKTELITETAQRLVYGDRNASYGSPKSDYEKTAKIWSGLLFHKLKKEIEPQEALLMMAAMKLSRLMHRHQPDSSVDAVGYMLCYEWVMDELNNEKDKAK